MSDIRNTKLRQLDFTLLLIMQGLLRHGRTIDVAQEMGLSQPAISHALRRLRDLFDDPLFVRKPHGFAPTHQALALASHVEAMLCEARDAIGIADTFDPATTPRDFRIGAPDHLGQLVAAPLLGSFERSAPRARFALQTSIGRDALNAVRHDQLDVALGQFLMPIDGLEVAPLYEDSYVLVSRARHPLIKSRVSKAVFGELQHVAVSVSGDFRGLTDEELNAHGYVRKIVATVPRFQTAFEMVRRSNGVVVAPSRLARACAGTFRLAVHKLPIDVRPIHVVAVRRVHRDPGSEWLLGLIRKALAPRAAPL